MNRDPEWFRSQLQEISSRTDRAVCIAIRKAGLGTKFEYKPISLEDSARCKCHYCSAVYEARPELARDEVNVWLLKHSLWTRYYPREGEGSNLDARLFKRDFFTVNTKGDPIIPTAREITGDTGSRQSFELIRTWIDTCTTTHKYTCPTPHTTEGCSRLPDRVIEVSLDTPRRIRLIETGERSEQYACLSHCWGNEYPLRTTRNPDTLSAHLKSIEEQALPKTFRDAITVIIGLEIRFIWIDSLCIIQDDEQDWQIQSAQMADIYANSTVTIAASASSGPHGGLFRVADPDYVGSHTSNFPHIRARRPLELDSVNLPLLKRGWALQERLLSPRVVHFAEQELIWECKLLLDCECQGTEPKPDQTRDNWPVSKSICPPTRWHSIYDSDSKVMLKWTDLINEYSKLALSKPDDIFPAISGIAKSFQETTGWNYVAGMWEQRMIHCLLWYTHDSAIRCVPSRAPTFSWASIQFDKAPAYGIVYPDLQREHIWGRTSRTATVVNAKCFPRGNDPTGQLKGGYIILSGTMVQATIHDHQDGFRIRTLPPEGENAATFPFDADIKLKQAGYEVHDGASVFCLKLYSVGFEVALFGIWLVLSRKNSTSWAWHDTKGDCEFERIGLMQSRWSDEWKDGSSKTFEQASSEQATQRKAVVKII